MEIVEQNLDITLSLQLTILHYIEKLLDTWYHNSHFMWFIDAPYVIWRPVTGLGTHHTAASKDY